jgi:hypothetical protein
MDRAPLHAQPEADTDLEEDFVPRRRPFGVTLFLWVVLSLSVWGLLRLFGAFSWWDVLSQFGARLSPLYLAITGAGWALFGAALLWGIFSRKSWAHPVMRTAIILWLVEYWIERIFFEAPRANLLFMIVLSVFTLALTLVITASRSTKIFLMRSEEHEQPEDSTPA